MTATVTSALILSAALAGQPGGAGQRPLSPAEVAKLESKHLSNIRQVTFGFFKAGEAYFSPDGERIVFQAVPGLPETAFLKPKANQFDYQIFMVDLKPGAKPTMISTGEGACTCAYFAPDGQSLIYASTHLNPTPPEARGGDGRYNWSFPEGMDIFHVGLDGKDPRRLTDANGYDAEGSYSPDGKHIVFTSFRDADGDGEIYVMDADGANPRRITHAKGYDGGPFFSPDGKKIIYRSDRKGNDLLQLFINDVEGTDERQLTDDESVNWCPYFFPDSKHVVYATSRHSPANFELYLMNVETGAEERLTFHSGFDGLPVFSPDGKKLMWTSNGRGPDRNGADRNSQIFIADFTLDPAPEPGATSKP